MIRVVRSKVSKAPEDNYTEAACDGCGAVCPESRVLRTRGDESAEAAHKEAQEHGWKERLVKEGTRRRRMMSWTVELLCPACQEKGAEE